MGVIPYDDGWGPLFERATMRALTHQPFLALDPRARVDIGPQIRAYSIFKTGVSDSLRTIFDTLRPTIVGKSEFLAAIREAAGIVASAMRSKEPFVVPIPRGIKSNLWVFLLVAKELCKICADWRKVRERIYLYIPDKNENFGQKKVHLLMLDDCVYSGEQMGGYGRRCMKHLNVSRVTLLPMFATLAGLASIRSRMQCTLSVNVPGGIIDYAKDTLSALQAADIAFCVRNGRRWTVVSLCNVLGVLRYAYDGASAVAYLNGATATVFRHKLADSLSVPTGALMVGPTLRGYLTRMCDIAPCNLDSMHVIIMKYNDWLRGIHGLDDRALIGTPVGDFACSDALMRSVMARTPFTDCGKCVFTRMPMYAPLLQPVDACGEKVSLAIKSGDTRDADVWDLVPDEKLFSMQGESRCVAAPYKAVLHRLVGTEGPLALALGTSE